MATNASKMPRFRFGSGRGTPGGGLGRPAQALRVEVRVHQGGRIHLDAEIHDQIAVDVAFHGAHPRLRG